MKILLIEDDRALCDNIKQQLAKENYIIDSCYDGEEALLLALNLNNSYDLAIIDRMLPIVDGLTIIKAMRNKNIQIPIIIITGMSELSDKIEGLDNGADDYLVKPFHISELSARIRALIRRPNIISEKSTLIYHDLSLDLGRKELYCNSTSVALTPKEFHLMSVLLDKPNTIITRDHFMQKVWEADNSVEPGNIDNYIYFLRKRIRTLNSTCSISSIYGSGYMLEVYHDRQIR